MFEVDHEIKLYYTFTVIAVYSTFKLSTKHEIIRRVGLAVNFGQVVCMNVDLVRGINVNGLIKECGN